MKEMDQKRDRTKCIKQTKEKLMASNRKYFLTRLIVSHYLKYFYYETGGVVNPDRGHSKKSESINHVYLKAVKILYEKGLFGDDLYPNLNRYINKNLIGSMKPNENS